MMRIFFQTANKWRVIQNANQSKYSDESAKIHCHGACHKRQQKGINSSRSYHQFMFVVTWFFCYYRSPSTVHFPTYLQHYLTCTVLMHSKIQQNKPMSVFLWTLRPSCNKLTICPLKTVVKKKPFSVTKNKTCKVLKRMTLGYEIRHFTTWPMCGCSTWHCHCAINKELFDWPYLQ